MNSILWLFCANYNMFFFLLYFFYLHIKIVKAEKTVFFCHKVQIFCVRFGYKYLYALLQSETN